MTSDLSSLVLENQPKRFLIIDDEYVDLVDKKGITKRLGLPEGTTIFAKTYEEGRTIIQNISVASCILDCKIPKNEEGNYDIYWGLELLPFLKEKKILTVICSAFVQAEDLKDTVNSENCLIGAVQKPYNPEAIERIKNLFWGKFFLTELDKEKQTNLSELNFDYDKIDKEIGNYLKFIAINVKQWAKKQEDYERGTIEAIVEQGKLLLEAKVRIAEARRKKIYSGTYEQWCQNALGFQKSTVSRYTNVFKASRQISIDELRLLTNRRALYKLTSKSTPIEVLKQAVTLAKDNVKIDLEIVEQLKEEHEKKKSEPLLLIESKINKTENKEIIFERSPLELVDERKGYFNTKTSSIAPATKPLERSQIIKINPNYENSCWQINQNFLFCGQFSINILNKYLPPILQCKIELLIGKNYKIEPFKDIKAKNTLTIQSPYKDINLESIANIISSTIYSMTDAEETIFFNCIFDPEIFKLAQNLNCLCYIVEPNVELCREIIEQSPEKNRLNI